MPIAKTVFLLCLLLGLAQPLHAAVDLFYAEVEIENESAEARQASIASAFHKVLIKLTGNSKIADHEGVARLLKKSPDYVIQYRYRVDESSSDTQQVTRFIQVQFDRVATERALADLRIPTWEGTRPEVLLWLAYEHGGKPKLLDAETLPEAGPLLQRAAGDRGLPLQLPLMDLQDQAALSGADVWNANEQDIRLASSRYPHDVILTARITGSEGGKWNGEWILLGRTETREFSRRGDDLTHVLKRGMDRAADLLEEIYAPVVTGEASEPVSVRVLQVNTLADYARVMDLFRQQSGVSRVMVQNVEADALTLDVWISGGSQVLSNSLQLHGELVPVADAEGAGEIQTNSLVFRINY